MQPTAIRSQSQQFLTDDTVDLLEELPRRSALTNQYTKGQVIFGAGSTQVGQIHVVQKGQILLRSMARNGRFIGLDILESEDVFGLELLASPSYTTAPVCGSDCETVSWNFKEIRLAMQTNSRLGIGFAQVLAIRNEQLKVSIERFATMGISSRLAAFLKDKADKLIKDEKGDEDGTAILPPYTHELLSEFIGTSREIVTHFMNEFRREGYLTYNRRFLRVTNPDGLLQWTMNTGER